MNHWIEGLPAELEYVLLLFVLFVVPRLLQRFRIPSAISALALGAALLRQARPGATRALAAFALYAAPVLGFAALWARAFGW